MLTVAVPQELGTNEVYKYKVKRKKGVKEERGVKEKRWSTEEEIKR